LLLVPDLPGVELVELLGVQVDVAEQSACGANARCVRRLRDLREQGGDVDGAVENVVAVEVDELRDVGDDPIAGVTQLRALLGLLMEGPQRREEPAERLSVPLLGHLRGHGLVDLGDGLSRDVARGRYLLRERSQRLGEALLERSELLAMTVRSERLLEVAERLLDDRLRFGALEVVATSLR